MAVLHQTSIDGPATLRRIGFFRFPMFELAGAAGPIAHLARDSSMSIFFGRGRRVRLPDGTELRIKATASGPHIVPIVTCDTGTLAVSGPLFADRSYGINGKDYAYFLSPLGKVGLRRTGSWVSRRHELEVAFIDDSKHMIDPSEPLPVAVILLVFTLIAHGIPGEANLMPPRD